MPLTAQGLLFSEPDVASQLALLALWAGLWFALLGPLARRCVRPYVLSRPWKEQWAALARRYFKSALFVEFQTPEDALDFACLFVAIMFQHGLGGALCIPSALGLRSRVVAAMACHGALCEAGWELQDSLARAFALAFGGAEGRSRNPPALLVVLALHHSMGLGMVLPMNASYGDSPQYHELVLLMQGAAFLAMAAQFYGWTLDVSTRSGLRQMRACAGFTMLLLVWTRVLRFAQLGRGLVLTFLADGNERFAYVGCLVLCTMGVVNLLFTVDAVAKFRKFASMSLPADGLDAKAESEQLGRNCTARPRRALWPTLMGSQKDAKQHQK